MLAYRLLVDVYDEREYIERFAFEQFHAWLRSKGYDADALTYGQVVRLGDRVKGGLAELTRADGSRSVRARIVEDNPMTGEWATALTVHVPGQRARRPWLWLDVDAPEDRRAAVPRLARNLLEVCDARDGGARLGPEPIPIGIDDVGHVVASICDERRRCLIFIAGSDDRAPDLQQRWHGYVSALLRDTVGLSAAYVLDVAATAVLSNALGPAHAVAPWTVRTFRPGVEPDDLVNAAKHRVLSTERIISATGHSIAMMLGRRAREAAVDASVPAGIARVVRDLEAHTDSQLLERLARSEPVLPTPALPEPRVKNDVLTELKGRLHKYELRNTELEQERHLLTSQLDDIWLEYCQAQEERDAAQARVRYLQVQLVASGNAEQAYAQDAAAEHEPPSDFEALLRSCRKFDHIQFTGDEESVHELDRHDQLGTWARKIWNVLCALNDYAQVTLEGSHAGGVHQYLQAPPSGCYTYPADRHGRDESDDVKTNPKFRRARMLPVPVTVAPEGKAFMSAHFKIAQYGLISPRLHYLDHVSRTGKIYVGYIGKHLPTRRTN